jgi:AraC-like DNA-binding protein
MKHFYYYYEWKEREAVFPCLKRARYFRANGPRQEALYLVNLPEWVIDIAFSADGTAWRSEGADRWTVQQINELHIYPPHTCFETRYESGGLRHSAFVQFKNGDACGLRELFSAGQRVYILNDTPQEIIKLMQQIAITGYHRQEAGFWEAQTLLLELLARLHRIRGEQFEQSATFSRNVDNFLRRNLSIRLTSARLAGMLGVSVSQLNHRYLQETGISPIRRQLEMRLEYAGEMILNNNSLTEIAEKLGFSSPFHLSRAFKKHYGASPAEFRRRAM